MMGGRGSSVTKGTRGHSRSATSRITHALLSAFILALVSGIFLWGQPTSAAAHAGATRDPLNSLVAADVTDTPTVTATDTPAPTATNTPAPTATPSSPYVLDVSGAAAASGWPQTYSNWCGIATIALVASYLGNSVSQSAIYNMLNTQQSESIWGYPVTSPSYWGPYLAANISGDFGTDPRSLAEGMTLATGRLYHVKVGLGGAWDTTVHIVRDMLIAKQPISIIVDHGMHSVIVSGVEATGDPLSNPNSITAIHIWDPGGGINHVGIQSAQHAVVPISTWLSGSIAWSGSSYFKYPYAANVYSGKALDPDPAVGPYAYDSAQVNHLWIGHYVYISPLASGDTANLSPDWELNQNGTLIAGLPNATWPNLPDGYTGASVPMPTNPPPPPPPVKPPVIAPKKAPLPPPRPTPTPRATATATALPTATAAPVMPTATSQPKAVCSPISCVFATVQNDATLQAGAWLVLLLLVMWFPAAIMVARLRLLRARNASNAKGEMLAALAPGDALLDAPTEPTEPSPEAEHSTLASWPKALAGETPDVMPGAGNAETPPDSAPAESDAPGALDIPVD
jgi:hypothetical protein